MADFCHFDAQGASRMVDVGDKPTTERMARASALVTMAASTLATVRGGKASKGDVLGVARLAGIMAAKRTSDLIPLCHPLPLDAVEVAFSFPNETSILVEATAKVTARTGVEMEALVGASVAALTIYDMCKGVDRAMSIEAVRLEEKSGGQSGHFQRSAVGSG